MNPGLERLLPAKCGSSAPRSHRRKAILSPVALTTWRSATNGERDLHQTAMPRAARRLERLVRPLPDSSKVTRLQIAPELMACFGGTDNLGYDANNPTRVVVADP